MKFLTPLITCGALVSGLVQPVRPDTTHIAPSGAPHHGSIVDGVPIAIDTADSAIPISSYTYGSHSKVKLVSIGNSTVGYRGGVICETSNASPITSDTRKVGDILMKKGTTRCIQGNFGGSFCTQMKNWGSAAAGICGTPLYSVSCLDAGWCVDQVARLCIKNGKSGGKYFVDNDVSISVYHS